MSYFYSYVKIDMLVGEGSEIFFSFCRFICFYCEDLCLDF